jgi:hypothetical protein
VHEALELGREDHVHEQECQAKRDEEVRIRFFEALGLPDELPAVIRRQIERLDVVPQFGDGLSEGLAFEVGGDDDLPLPRLLRLSSAETMRERTSTGEYGRTVGAAPMASAAARLSPEIITTRKPRARSAAKACCAPGLG